jgi:hypothetical protein
MEVLNSEPRCADTPMRMWVDYSVVPSPYQDFEFHGIANSDFNGFKTFLSPIPDMACHLSSTNSCCGPHNSPIGILRIAISNYKSNLSLKSPDAQTLTSLNLLTCVQIDGRFWARRDIADHDIAILVAQIWSFDSRIPDTRYHV